MTKLKPVIEQYIYEEAGIQIGIQINYTKEEITLVEHDGTDKTWLFVRRGREYTQGWLAILSIMQEAIQHAQERLQAYKDKEFIDFVEMVHIASGEKDDE